MRGERNRINIKAARDLGPFTLWPRLPLLDHSAPRPVGFWLFLGILGTGLGAFVLSENTVPNSHMATSLSSSKSLLKYHFFNGVFNSHLI